MPLPDDLVTDDRGSCRHVEGTDLAEHRHGQQNVASPRDERPQAAAFASQDEAERARQVGVPRGDPSRRGIGVLSSFQSQADLWENQLGENPVAFSSIIDSEIRRDSDFSYR